jgi:hypothetical protein
VQHTKNAYLLPYDPVCRDVGSAVNDQFTCTSNTTWPAALRKVPQLFDMPTDAIVYDDCSLWVVCFDLVEDRLSVRCRELRPLHTQ